ncbi:uncharacterized protein [Clytia hemisphaerica]
MMKLNHRIHNGAIFEKEPNATYAFKYHSSIDEYLETLCANRKFGEKIDLHKEKIRSHMEAEFVKVLPSIEMDYDYIEVDGGWFFKFSTKGFVKGPFHEEELGKIAPRCYKNFDCNAECDSGCFATSVENSFPELRERVNLLNKFYQCLLCFQFPHKVPRIVTSGSNNSGKTSWANVLLGLIPHNNVAILSKEKTFGSMIINKRTELLFIDEWVYETMAPDQVKSILQGGYFSQAVKNQKPRRTKMNGGIYITCQAMPKFDSIDVGAVDCRVQEFTTRKLETKDMTAPAWMLEHSFECLMWLVNMLVIHRDLIKPEELFYERPHDVSAGARLNIDMTEEKARQLIECTGSTDEEDGEIETGYHVQMFSPLWTLSNETSPATTPSSQETASPFFTGQEGMEERSSADVASTVFAFSPPRAPLTPMTPVTPLPTTPDSLWDDDEYYSCDENRDSRLGNGEENESDDSEIRFVKSNRTNHVCISSDDEEPVNPTIVESKGDIRYIETILPSDISTLDLSNIINFSETENRKRTMEATIDEIATPKVKRILQLWTI